MDDFVLNVRQIGQFPAIEPQPSDVVLVQQGGQGGAYASSTTLALIQGAVSGSAQVTFGGPLGASELIVPGGGAITGINGLDFGFVTNDRALPLMTLTVNGDLQLPYGNLSIGRDPATLAEATSRGWVQEHTVWSFGGRTGIVQLNAGDVNTALGVQPGDFLVTRNFVDAQICQSLQQFYTYSPLVFSFNGRTGDITLTLDDINTANFSVPGSYPQAPSPALGDASNNIATTSFVDESLQDFQDTFIAGLQEEFAPINSPNFTGVPTVPMPPVGSSDATIPTTAWVMEKITGSVTGVASFNTRTGAVTLTLADVTGAGGAPINSPNFTGTPTAPTPAAADSSTKLATTAFVTGLLTNSVSSFNTRTGAVVLSLADITGAGGAPIASPVFTGTPQAPSPPAADSSLRLATTAWVSSNAVNSFNGRTGTVSLQLNDITAAGGAPLASPAFTGTPTVPTAAPGTNTTQAASTAFVEAAVTGMTAGVTSWNTRTGAVTFTQADLTGAGGALVQQIGSPQCGRLQLGAASPSPTLQYVPYKGNAIKINGAIYQFALFGATNNNATINGVAGQTLANNTTYLVFAYWTGTTVAMDFVLWTSTGHSTSNTGLNTGTEVKTGDETRSLIGIITTGGSGLFVDTANSRLTRSWFNRMPVVMQSGTINHAMTAVNTSIALTGGGFNWVQFGDDSVSFGWGAQVICSTATTTVYATMYVDGAQASGVPWASATSSGSANSNVSLPVPYQTSFAEGYHLAACYGQTSAATATFSGFASARLIAS